MPARAVRPLAELMVRHGLGVVVPDWNSHADDGGRADLLRSVHFARERVDDPDGLVLVGWSMGGVAAAGLTIQARRVDVGFAHTVCLAGAFMVTDPIFGRVPATQLKPGARRCPFTLLHGLSDDVIPVAATHEFASALRRNEWPVEVVELPADHGSIAGASYDTAADRYSAADDPRLWPSRPTWQLASPPWPAVRRRRAGLALSCRFDHSVYKRLLYVSAA